MWYLRAAHLASTRRATGLRHLAARPVGFSGRKDIVVIRVGIVGCNYGRTVLLPAFRTDPRCDVVALAGTDATRTAQLAREANVARGTGDWAALVEDRTVDAVAVAVPPGLQPEVARRALDLGK